MTSMTLPWPPSTNRLWRKFGTRMVLSDEARTFKESAGWIAKERCDAATVKPVAVTLTLFAPTKAGDLDNRIKAVLDSLNGIAYRDDRQVCELHVYRRVDRNSPRVEVEVCEL